MKLEPKLKLDTEEQEILGSYDRDEWISTPNLAPEKARYAKAARATLQKDRRVNIRMSSRDLDAIRVRAVEEGLPYQTLISSVLHKFAAGRLKEA